MRNPFSSDYVSANRTDNATTAAISSEAGDNAKKPRIIIPSASIAEAREYGFEPERYGLGKPKRIVTRGKIARG